VIKLKVQPTADSQQQKAKRQKDMKERKIIVKGKDIRVMNYNDFDFICLSDMIKAKDGDFFISDWLRNRNTIEFLGVWESIYNTNFNYGEFATIKSFAGLNSYNFLHSPLERGRGA